MNRPIKSINPATETEIARYTPLDFETAAARAEACAKAQLAWSGAGTSRDPYVQRREVLKRVAGRLRDQEAKLSELITTEMGKIRAEAEAEVEKCAWVCEHYADHGESALQAQPITSFASSSYLRYEPLGVVLAIMPWNFPLWQVFRCAAPTLMAGNGVVLKHASNVSGCALAIEKIFAEAGTPTDLFVTLLLSSDHIERLIAHRAIAAVTITGSTPAGRAVASAAGQHLKPSVLELGGSDPYLILEDAELESAVEACTKGRLLNCGQSCIAAKRFIVTPPIASRFVEALVELMRTKRFGPPLEDGIDLGPMARGDLRDDLEQQVGSSLERGAKLALGGRRPPGRGYYFPPTVLTNVHPGMPAFDEELFGPVAAVIVADSEEHAVELGNATPFGLGAAVFTRDLDRGRAVAHQLKAGSCFVNAPVRSDPRLPFGGIGDSGYGRELGDLGIRTFVNAKTVVICGDDAL